MRIELSLQALVMCSTNCTIKPVRFKASIFSCLGEWGCNDQHRSWQNSNETKKSFCYRYIFKQNRTHANIFDRGYLLIHHIEHVAVVGFPAFEWHVLSIWAGAQQWWPPSKSSGHGDGSLRGELCPTSVVWAFFQGKKCGIVQGSWCDGDVGPRPRNHNVALRHKQHCRQPSWSWGPGFGSKILVIRVLQKQVKQGVHDAGCQVIDQGCSLGQWPSIQTHSHWRWAVFDVGNKWNTIWRSALL